MAVKRAWLHHVGGCLACGHPEEAHFPASLGRDGWPARVACVLCGRPERRDGRACASVYGGSWLDLGRWTTQEWRERVAAYRTTARRLGLIS